ncbi:MAG: acyl-CoA dehydrogenase family protein, partial [Marinosulfonomonas sp.]|nr:acyl-CoA dehydrogenase family protein [Marinosulfonomonas sp.]
MDSLKFSPPPVSEAAEMLRLEVRAFLKDALAGQTATEKAQSWNGHNPEFSRLVGKQGWLGMTWPKQYGGQERSALERYVVVEEMLAAGAPVSAHWIAERQSGPTLLRYGTQAQRDEILPKILRGECYFAIGMSEPNSGSDLASVQTRAVKTDGGFVVNGSKIWTSNAHLSHYMILFCRTDARSEDRHSGHSQFLVDMKTPGLEIRPILFSTGEHQFNEVFFKDMFLPDEALIGQAGQGWKQVTGELSFERSGPDRFLTSFAAVKGLSERIGTTPDDRGAIALGRIVAHLMVLRRMSRSIAGMLEDDLDPALQAAIVKDLGTTLEQEIPEIARHIVAVEPGEGADGELEAVLDYIIQHAPTFSLRGGTREILRGIIARGAGLR